MNPTAASQQQFCVRWKSHLKSLGCAIPQLLAGKRFIDVTLACEGHQVHCHRLVLAACSTYFESLLSENPCKHPIVIMPHDIKLWEIQALVDFMYEGEVNVSQAGLPYLLKCAKLLQIRGLCSADAALVDDADYTRLPIKQPNEKQLHHPTKTQQHLIENSDDDIDDSYRKEKRKYKRKIYKYLKSGHSRPPMLDHDYDKVIIFIDESDESESETINNNKIKENLEEVSRNRGQHMQGQSQDQDEIEEVEERERDQYQNEDQQIDDIKDNCDSSTDEPEDQGGFRNNLRKRPNPALDENLPVLKRPTVTLNPIGQLQNLGCGSSTSSTKTTTGAKFGKTRVKPDENLYENYSKIQSIINETEDEMIQQLPASLKFNKDEMQIFVKIPEESQRNSMTPSPLIRKVRSLAGSHSTYNKATGRYRELVDPITVGNVNSTQNSGIQYPSSPNPSPSPLRLRKPAIKSAFPMPQNLQQALEKKQLKRMEHKM